MYDPYHLDITPTPTYHPSAWLHCSIPSPRPHWSSLPSNSDPPPPVLLFSRRVQCHRTAMPICRLQIPPSTSCLSVSHLKEGLYYIWTRQGFLHCSPCPLSSNGQSDLIDPLLWLPSLDVSPPPPFASVCHIIIRGLVDEFGFSFSFSTVILFNVVPTYTILISLLSVPSPPPTYCRSHPDPTPYLHISTIHRLTHNSPPHTSRSPNRISFWAWIQDCLFK